MATNRRNGFIDQVRVTGEVSTLPRPRRRANPLGRSRTSSPVVFNHLDALIPMVRKEVERVATARGVFLTDVVVISPTEAIIP